MASKLTRFRFWISLIHVTGVIGPRRLRADWRQEWEALRYREAIAGVLFLVAAVACWIPARRAIRVDPMIAMRNE